MYINVKGKVLALSGAAQNWIGSKAGGQTVKGTAKNDVIYDSGSDRMYGGLGDDVYHFWNATSSAREESSSGIDTVISHRQGAVYLWSNIENLFLDGYGANEGYGNELDNIIAAGSYAATLDGRSGDDVLVSGAGADRFVVKAGNGSDKIVGFQTGFDAISLTGYGISSFAKLKTMAEQVGADTKINLPNGEVLILENVALKNLSAFDFLLKMPALVAGVGETLMSGAGKGYTADGWYVLNNVWNPGSLIENKQYTISSTYHKGDANSDVTFQWSFPFATEAHATIRAFPEIIFGPAPMSGGQKSSDIGETFPVQISDIADLTLDYTVDFTGNTGGFNVAFDIWLTSIEGGGASTVSNEIMIWVHEGDFAPYGSLVGTYVTEDFSASVYHAENYTAVVLDEDMKSGEIDLRALFDYLIEIGIVTSDEYLASVELGAEVVSGAGSLMIDHLDIDLTSVSDAAAAVSQLSYTSVVVAEDSLVADAGWSAWGVDSLAA
jgi:serralysin